MHCETSSSLFSLSPFTYQLPRVLHKSLGQSQSSQIRKKTRHLAPSTSAKGSLALWLWRRAVTPAGAKDDSELLARVLSIWFYKVWGFISVCNVMCSSLATHFQGGHPAGWRAAGCLAAARWGAWARPRGSSCCSASRTSHSLLQIPHQLLCSGSSHCLSALDNRFFWGLSFGGFLYFGCERSSQMSEAEKSPFIGPVFQTTGVWSTPINSCIELLKLGTLSF